MEANPLVNPVSSRRHSIAVHSVSPTNAATEGQTQVSSRRKSISSSIQLMTKSLSTSLRSIMNGSSTGSLDGLGSNNLLDKAFIRTVLANHYNQQDLRVSKLNCRKRPSLGEEVSRHDVEVWIKMENTRKQLYLVVKAFRDQNAREIVIYNTILTDMRQYLLSHGIENTNILCFAPHFLFIPTKKKDDFLLEAEAPIINMNPINEPITINESSSSNEPINEPIPISSEVPATNEMCNPVDSLTPNTAVDLTKILITENMRIKRFQHDTLTGEGLGLDYEHCVLVVGRLARLHAVSFSMRMENNLDLESKYPALFREHIPVLQTHNSALIRLENILSQDTSLQDVSSMFLEIVQNEDLQAELLEPTDKFGVVCHGDLWRGNVLFRYTSELECRLYCSDLVFQDASHCHYGSCVLDLLQFLFTSVDPSVRSEFMPDLVCSVYYDNFHNTVKTLNPSVQVFTKNQFLKEFSKRLMFGFLEGLNLHTQVYEAQIMEKKLSSRKDSRTEPHHDVDINTNIPSYTEYRDAILNIVRDITKFKMKASATLHS